MLKYIFTTHPMGKLTIFNRNYVNDPADLRDVLEHLFEVDIID